MEPVGRGERGSQGQEQAWERALALVLLWGVRAPGCCSWPPCSALSPFGAVACWSWTSFGCFFDRLRRGRESGRGGEKRRDGERGVGSVLERCGVGAAKAAW